MTVKKRGDLSVDLLGLQNKVKRDPSLYYEEFSSHYEQYRSILNLFTMKNPPMMKPPICTYNEELADLVSFLAQVSSCYKKDLADYPQELMNILKENFYIMDSDMRMCFCKALILMRNKGMVEAIDLIPLFFYLLRAKDKLLRKLLQNHIISDIKRMNAKHKNVKLNKTLQNLMQKTLKEGDCAVASKMSLDIMIELYKKNIWNDEKTVNAIADACTSKVNKILVAAHQFFLGSEEIEEENDGNDSEKDDDTPSVKDVMAANKVNKKSRRRMKILKRTKQALKRTEKKKNKEVFDFSAIRLLNNPEGMAEDLLELLNKMNERYEIKMMVMNLISRLVGIHKVILLNYHTLLIRYLKPHQRDVTKILTFAAQATHEKVPPDAIEQVVKTIAYNFVTERNSFEAMTVGINAIREICARCPHAITPDLLQDIAEYNNYKNKNVAMAARSLIHLYRKIDPSKLKRKFKSRPTEASKELDSLEYGALNAKSYIPGSEVLPIEPPEEDKDEKNASENDEEDSDDDWIKVSHSEDAINIDSDYDDKGVEEKEDSNEVKEGSNDRDDEEDKEKEKRRKETYNIDAKQKAMLISQSRILSQEEFKILKAAEIAKEVQFAKGKKRKLDMEVNYEKEIVSLKDIEKLYKKPKTDKATRLATVLEGREGREKFGKKKTKNPNSGKTQREHNKRKAFMMIKHKVRSKQKKSFKDKQIALQNALLKRKRNK